MTMMIIATTMAKMMTGVVIFLSGKSQPDWRCYEKHDRVQEQTCFWERRSTGRQLGRFILRKLTLLRRFLHRESCPSSQKRTQNLQHTLSLHRFNPLRGVKSFFFFYAIFSRFFFAHAIPNLSRTSWPFHYVCICKIASPKTIPQWNPTAYRNKRLLAIYHLRWI